MSACTPMAAFVCMYEIHYRHTIYMIFSHAFHSLSMCLCQIQMLLLHFCMSLKGREKKKLISAENPWCGTLYSVSDQIFIDQFHNLLLTLLCPFSYVAFYSQPRWPLLFRSMYRDLCCFYFHPHHSNCQTLMKYTYCNIQHLCFDSLGGTHNLLSYSGFREMVIFTSEDYQRSF